MEIEDSEVTEQKCRACSNHNE